MHQRPTPRPDLQALILTDGVVRGVVTNLFTDNERNRSLLKSRALQRANNPPSDGNKPYLDLQALILTDDVVRGVVTDLVVDDGRCRSLLKSNAALRANARVGRRSL